MWPEDARPGSEGRRVLLDTAPALVVWVVALQLLPSVTLGVLQATRVALLYAAARG